VRANQLCVSTICYHPFSLERALAGIAALGARNVELAALVGFCDHAAPERLGSGAAATLRRLLADHGLTAVSVSGHADLSTDTGRDAFAARLRLAAELGVGIVNTEAAEGTGPDVEERFYSNIGPLADLAVDLKITIGLETHGSLTGTAGECAAVLTRVDRPNVRVNYDTANLIFYRGVRPEDDLPAIASEVVHVHVKDKASMALNTWDFPAIGAGIIDWPRIVRALDTAGFDGPASLEVELDGHPQTAEVVDEALQASWTYLQGIVTA
jgi:sugar phosphate isomerase/epimerase